MAEAPEKSIELHKEHGVNPRMMICKHCDADIGVILVGVRDYKDTCDKCGLVHYGGADDNTCQGCGLKQFTRDKVALNERIPGGVCDACEAIIKARKDLLMAEYEKVKHTGAIFFHCAKCASAGLVKGETEVAKDVRARLNIPIPAPCGLTLHGCPNCSRECSKGDEDGQNKSECNSALHN